jgi:hypothetical protein
MGAALTFKEAMVIKAGQPLRVRYSLYVHSGIPAPTQLDQRWSDFARTSFQEFRAKP